MGVPHVTSFCWCFGLEMGAKIVGVIHMLAGLTLMILCSMYAETFRSYIGTVEDAEDHLYSSWYKIAVGAAALSVVHVLLASLLLISISKRSVSGLRVWVYVMLVLYVAALLYIIVTMAMHGVSDSGSDIFLSFLEGLLFFSVLAYFILTVYSYHLMLRSVEDMEGPNKVDY